MIKVLFICHGNICRSTMAQYVLQDMVNKRGIANDFLIDSAATSCEEIGNGVHYGTRNKLRQEGIPCGDHRARQITKKDYRVFDYLIGMDTANIRNIHRILGSDPEEKVYKLLSFAGSTLDIADPWYSGDFESTFRDVKEGCEAFLAFLRDKGEL